MAVTTTPQNRLAGMTANTDNRERLRSVIVYALIILLTIILAFPFYYLATSAFKPTDELFEYPPTLWPRTIIFNHFSLAFQAAPFAKMLLNTFVICGINVMGAVLSNSLAAYAIARLRFPFKNIIFGGMLLTLMIPGWVSLVPGYIFWRDVGRFTNGLIGLNIGVNSIGPLTIPTYLTSAFSVFLMRQYFMTIPKELEEAARIDGASYFKIYWRIFLPLSFPVLAVVGIGAFMASWNDVLGH